VVSAETNTKLLIVGDEVSPEIRQYSRDLGVESSVEFIDEVPLEGTVKSYQKASVFVIPSIQEGLCISGVEAMACGLPVVSTRCGGPEDYVEEGMNGFLVPPGNEELMADRIVQLLRDETMRARFGRKSREIVEAKFNTQKFRQILSEVYQETWPEYFPRGVT
jgi:glycosyltransferase involved in cell wall biosynthesis